jgi:hypothetical protein
MNPLQFDIIDKQRQPYGSLSSLDDFVYAVGDVVSLGMIVDNPATSLYCLDDTGRQAIFVELPTEIDLTKEPFVYRAQYEHALRLFALPYTAFNQIAQTLPDVQHPIFVHMSGRSGSTLLHHLFNESQSVLSLSEPDVATQFVALRYNAKMDREDEFRELAQSVVRFLFKDHHLPRIQAHALKFRNQGVQVIDLYQAVFPQAKNLFLYRDAIGYVTSFRRVAQQFGVPEFSPIQTWQQAWEAHLGADLTHLVQLMGKEHFEISISEQLTIWWLAVMEWYLDQFDKGNPILAVRFADLITAREEVVEAVFRYCGLPLRNVRRALRAYNRDSQAGSPFAREDPDQENQDALTESDIRSINALLGRHPVLNISDFTVPGTLDVPRSYDA